MKIEVLVASEKHLSYVTAINDAIDNAAKARGTGIARRTNEYITGKIRDGKAIIALNREEFVGFCYIESWGHQKFVANSGLIVVPAYRGLGVAKKIKKAAFDLSRRRFPRAKLFGLTTGEQVMRINTSLGYVPVTFAKLTDDEEFWAGCKSCVNYDILQRTNMTKCLCTGMIYDPEAQARPGEVPGERAGSLPGRISKRVCAFDLVRKVHKVMPSASKVHKVTGVLRTVFTGSKAAVD